jgi:PAS domain S-box-containing protein
MSPSTDRPATKPPASLRIWLDLLLIAAAGLLVSAALFDLRVLLPARALALSFAAAILLGVLLRRAQAHASEAARRLAAELGESVQRLATSEERYRMLVEHAGDPILTFDLADNITSMNRAAELLFGWEREALIGAPAHRLFAGESVGALQRWTRASLLTPAEPTQIEVMAVHREGRVLHLEAHAAVFRTGGVPAGTELVCRDTTARTELERLRADFLAMMSHDIRNPLGAIFGYTEMMLDTAHWLSAEQREVLLRINSNTRTVLTLVGNFLEASKIEAGRLLIDRRPVDVNAIVRRTADQYAAHARLVDIDLTIAPTPELPEIAADGLQVERITANLLTNAIKFTPRGGRVTITTERLPSSVAIVVADTGIGIPPHEFSRIFQRYARAGDRNREGTGLGLYIVGTLVEAHGGFVTIDSTPGSGTTFTVYLPICDWRAAQADGAVPAVTAAAPVQ